MIESLINAVISISPQARRGELKISEAKSLRTDRFLSRVIGIEMTRRKKLSLAAQSPPDGRARKDVYYSVLILFLF